MKSLFVLKRQPLQEQDWLYDVFSAEQGRLMLVNVNKNTPAGSDELAEADIDLFQLCHGDWQADGDWPRIRGLQRDQLYSLQGRELFCAFYLNELLLNLLPQHEPQPLLFNLYQQVLTALANGELAEPWLRLFENQLLQQLGYAFSWTQCHDHSPVRAEGYYRFDAQQGFVQQRTATGAFAGQYLLAFAAWQQNFANIPADVNVWLVAKRVLRIALEHILERPLISRELFHAPAYSAGKFEQKKESR